MTRTSPIWVRGADPATAEMAGDNLRLRKDVARDRLRARVVGHLPTDQDSARRELTEGERAMRSSRPKNRRWRALDKHDQTIDRLTQKQADAGVRLQEAEALLQQAPQHDARTLADWVAGGERGERPAPTMYDRQRDRDAAGLLVEAVTIEVDQALERRLQHVEQHRDAMVNDARKDINEARDKLLAHLRELPAIRQTLLAARETLLWAASFPEPAESFGFPTSTALGLRQPVEKALGTRARIEYLAVIEALEADADAVATSFGAGQKAKLGVADPRSPVRDGMWLDDKDDPDLAAWKKQELQRAKDLHRWSADPIGLAGEARDLRP